MYHKSIILFILLSIGELNAQTTFEQPIYTPKKLISNYLDTTKFKNSISKNEVTHYILAKTLFFDVSDDKTHSIRGQGEFVICFKGKMKKGKKNGIFNAYFIEDNESNSLILNMAQEYRNDKRHGQWKTYDLSGNLLIVEHFKNDSIHGIQTVYDFQGNKINEANYKNGELFGLVKVFYPNGSIKESQEFKDKQRHGTKKYFYENGQLWTEVIINKGKPWKIISNFDINGKARDAGSLKNGNGSVIYYNVNGSIREVINYKNGIEQ